MKKGFTLTLAALALAAALTGCSGTTYTDTGRGNMTDGFGNVSSTRNGRVNGINRSGDMMSELMPDLDMGR